MMNRPLLVLIALTLAGCPGGPKVAPLPTPKVSAKPAAKLIDATRVASGKLVKRSLGGIVSLLAGSKAAIVSDQGGGIISDNSGGIISDNSGGIISDNSGGIISDNSGGYVLLAALPESKLANAPIQIADAAGRVLTDAKGVPLGGKADAQGRYQLDLQLPDEPLVVRVPLSTGGRLEGFLIAGGAAAGRTPLDLGTASTVGARYVLDKYVQDDAARLAKLPAAEAEALTQAAAAALDQTGLVAGKPPSYKPDDVTALGDQARAKAPALDRQLQRIEALLLGQARLGSGRPALQVPLVRPGRPFVEPDGSLLFPESGRLRRIKPDGTLETVADQRFGLIKRTFPRIKAVLRAADGTIYVRTLEQVFRAGADGAVSVMIGPGAEGTLGTGQRLDDFQSDGMALTPDGTLHVMGCLASEDGGAPDRRFAFPPAGPVTMQVAAQKVQAFHTGTVLARPDGTLDFTTDRAAFGTDKYQAWRWTPGAEPAEVGGAPGFLADRAPDGTTYYGDGGTIVAVAPGGARTKLVGPGLPGARAIDAGRPSLGKDGTLYFDDDYAGAIWAMAPGGEPRRIGGYEGLLQVGATTDIASNGPTGAAFLPDGALLVAEAGRGQIARFDGARYEIVAGNKRVGYSGDGGPALGAGIGSIYALHWHAGTTYVAQTDLVRAIDPQGIIRTFVGIGEGNHDAKQLTGGESAAPNAFPLRQSGGIAVGPDGATYLSSTISHQIYRLSPDGKVLTLVAGRPGVPGAAPDDLPDGAPARETALAGPGALAFDAQGRLFFINGGTFTVYRIDGPAGDAPTITRVAGLGFAGSVAAGRDVAEGGPRGTLLVAPTALAFGPDGSMYLAESGTAQLARLTASGIDSTGFAAALGLPDVVPRVRRFWPDGKLTVVAGPGGAYFADPDAEEALVQPQALAFAPDGRLAIADPGANLIRILPAGTF